MSRHNFNTDGHISEEAIAQYAEMLQDSTRNNVDEDILTHIEACSICKQQIIDTYDIIQKTESASTPNWQFVFRVAAILIILMGISFIIRKNRNQLPKDITSELQQAPASANNIDTLKDTLNLNPDKELEEIGIDATLKSKKKKELFAANYEKSSEFEALVNTVFRTNVGVEIVSPLLNEVYNKGEQIEFAWEVNTKENVILKIFSNRNPEPLFIIREGSNSFQSTESMEYGLYYWKLETEEDLFYVGKFRVE